MASLEDTIGHVFADSSLRDLALTHRSADAEKNNQKLEFLGDRVLGIVIADMLYHYYSDEKEGELARRLAALVSGMTLHEVAREIDLGRHLILAPSEEPDGRDNDAILEDACEALIGALYLDGGMKVARDFIEDNWMERLTSEEEAPKDAKTALQEWAQARGLPLPHYQEIERSGPDHAPEFTIEVRVKDMRAQATANSKRVAERQAASDLLEQVNE